jgi:hypothetical protein
MLVETYFPNLTRLGYRLTSAADVKYKCIAWAADRTDAWWWPDSMGQGHWPENVPREETLPAFVRAFESLGYTPCDSDKLEAGFDKIALYARGGIPTHAARQVGESKWTSKLGEVEDIEHTLEGIAGAFYGVVVQILRRPSSPAR